MKQTLWKSRETVDELGKILKLEYFLLTEQVQGVDLYGLQIQMDRNGQEESASRLGITPQLEKADQLLKRLAEHTVTPCTLKEILDDLL